MRSCVCACVFVCECVCVFVCECVCVHVREREGESSEMVIIFSKYSSQIVMLVL